MLYVIFLIILLILLFYISNRPATFKVDRKKIIDELIEKQDLFINHTYREIKRKINWIDPAIYSDIKRMHARNITIDEKSLNVIF